MSGLFFMIQEYASKIGNNPKERAFCEALCVVTSEHFALYSKAEVHLRHGLDAVRAHFTHTGTTRNFYKILSTTRREIPNFSNGDFHSTLANRCDRKLTDGEYENGR